MKGFSKGNQGGLKADGHGGMHSGPIANPMDAKWRNAMTSLNDEYRNCKNGMIDYDRYRCLAAETRRRTRSSLMKAAWSRLVAYFKFPQNRWIRRPASSKSSVFVA